MSSTLVLPRDCYTAAEVRYLFARRLPHNGELKPLSRITLQRWRIKGKVQFIRLNSRTYMYPRASVQAILRSINNSLTPPPHEFLEV